MNQDVDAFLGYLSQERGYSPNTVAAYRNDLNQLMAHIEAEKQRGIIKSSGELLKSYLLRLREKKYSLATAARKIASTRCFFKFMVDSGKLSEDPTENLISVPVAKHPRNFLSPSDYRLLLAEPAKLSTPEARRDIVMLEVLYATGLRAGELVSLNVRDIDCERNCLHCVRGNSKREVPFDHHTSQLLKDFMRNDRLDLLFDEREEALFLNLRGQRLTRQGFWQIVKNYAGRAGLGAKVTPQALRHSFALSKLQAGADIRSVQQLLGHAYVSSTRAYERSYSKEGRE
jgi:integrase/recombinase XerD